MILKIEAINKSHNRKSFDCGQQVLNAYIAKIARQHNEKGLSKTFVLIDEQQPDDIIAYFTLVVCEIQPPQNDKQFKPYPHLLPVLTLARLAVDVHFQKKGYAKLLLGNVIHKALIIAEQVGIIGIVIDAKNQAVAAMYQKYDFIVLGDEELNLFMPISLCKQLDD